MSCLPVMKPVEAYFWESLETLAIFGQLVMADWAALQFFDTSGTVMIDIQLL